MAGSRYDVLIVGGGHGGTQTALALRLRRFGGSIAIIGDEPVLPYERPPLSKDYLTGERDAQSIQVKSEAAWAQRLVTLKLGLAVEAINPTEHEVSLQGGETFGYTKLIWATGGSARRLGCPGNGLAGVHSIRNLRDADDLIKELPFVRQVVVIGGGYIGLEATAALIKLGKSVVLLEAADRVLSRVAGQELSRFFEAEHRLQGADLRLNTTVDCLLENSGRVCGVRLAGGGVLDAQMVIVGIGIEPSVAALAAAGAAMGNGVMVDAFCRTSLPDIYAVGDCAAHANAFAGGATVRIESVQNAHDQANTAVRSITGDPEPYDAAPWFWSNQYDLKLRTIGLSSGFDETLISGDPSRRSFSVIYMKNRKILALDCVNSVRDFALGKVLIGTTIAPGYRLDGATDPLRQLIASSGKCHG